MHIYSKGPRSASVLVVGEAPGENEVKEGLPFVGTSGKELDKMLAEAGYDPAGVRITNVCHVRPPGNDISAFLGFPKKEAKPDSRFEHGLYFSPEVASGLGVLQMEIAAMPNLKQIIGLGNTPLWALTGNYGITKWRGSQMFAKRLTGTPIPFVPTYHPAMILRVWENRWIGVMDLKRARMWGEKKYAVPTYDFTIRPSFTRVCQYLNNAIAIVEGGKKLKLASDVETRQGFIACFALADSARSAICVPILTTTGNYWTADEEARIIYLLYRLTTNPLCEIIGQNYLYDQQYWAKGYGFVMRLMHDTMLKQHLILPGVEKGLDFISSQHCEYHLYWKDESKDWDPKLGEEQLWIYNCKDAVVTFEANDNLQVIVEKWGMTSQLADQMEDMDTALEMMLRGINVDTKRKERLSHELSEHMIDLLIFINKCLGYELQRLPSLDDYDKVKHLNPASPTQVQALAYKVLQLPIIWKKTPNGGRRPTADKDAVTEWLEKVDPLYRPLLQAIVDYRSLQVFKSTFADADLDWDGRWRCFVKVPGPETFRWATAKDAFGYGTNMQNISKGDEDD